MAITSVGAGEVWSGEGTLVVARVPRIALAFIDRLTHRGHVLEFAGESYRYRNRLPQSNGTGEAETHPGGEEKS